MNPIIKSKLDEMIALCIKRRVRRIAVFGSAARGDFDPATSDLDLLVEFQQMTPAQHADNYFGLLEDLQKLFGIEIDLLDPAPIENPYFKQAIEQGQVVLYETA